MTILLIAPIVSFTIIIPFLPITILKLLTPDAKAKEKPNKSYPAKHTKCQCLTLWFDFGRRAEQAPGEERSNGSAGCRQCLSQSV